MELLFTDVKSVLFMLLAVVALVVLSVLGWLATKALKSIFKKLGIELSEKQEEDIKGVVTSVVKFVNQKLVSVLKNANTDGKLTDDQKIEVYNKAVQLITQTMTDDQKNVLVQKYGNIDTALEIMIEASVADNHVDAKEVKQLLNESTN